MGYSDFMAMSSLGEYVYHIRSQIYLMNTEPQGYITSNNEKTFDTVVCLWWILVVFYLVSCVFMLLSPIVSSLRTAFRTAVDLSDTSLEQAGAEVSLGIPCNIYFLSSTCSPCSILVSI